MKRRELLAGALGATLARYVHAEKSSEGQELIGQTAPALQLRRWLHSPPIDMADLRGSDLTALDPVAAAELRGALIDAEQAVVIAQALGLEIR